MTPPIGLPEVVFILVVGIVTGLGHTFLLRRKGISFLRTLFSLALTCAAFGAMSMICIITVSAPLQKYNHQSVISELTAMASFYSLLFATPVAYTLYGLMRKNKNQ